MGQRGTVDGGEGAALGICSLLGKKEKKKQTQPNLFFQMRLSFLIYLLKSLPLQIAGGLTKAICCISSTSPVGLSSFKQVISHWREDLSPSEKIDLVLPCAHQIVPEICSPTTYIANWTWPKSPWMARFAQEPW